MAIDEIVRIIPPPVNPTYTGDEASWREFEAELPFVLPSDYRDYITTYGLGCLGDMFVVYSPFCPIKVNNFQVNCRDVRSNLINECEEWLSEDVTESHPGLILFGHDTNGSNLHWLTVGDPDEWPIIVGGGRNWQVSRYDLAMTSLFAGVLENTVGDEDYSPNLVTKDFLVVPEV